MMIITRMHSSRMRTVLNSSRLLGVCMLPGGGACSRGVPAPGGLPAPGGACSRGGVCSKGKGVPAPGEGGGISACTDSDPPCGQTHTCKNITFTTSLQTVNITCYSHY